MRPRTVALVAGLSVAAAAGFYTWAWADRPPTLDCPATLDCEPIEAGQTSTVRFAIRNPGDTLLELTEIRSSCGCAGLEYEADGAFTRLAELAISPRSFGRVAARVTVTLPTDSPLTQSIWFRTNDPARPEHKIVLSIPPVRVGLRANPRELMFGAVPVEGTAERLIEVTDARRPSRRINRVSVSPDTPFTARLLSGDTSRSDLSVVAVRFTPTAVGVTDAVIELWPEGEVEPHSVRVPVTGRGVPPAELVPSSVVLPLASDGPPIFATDVLCRVSAGQSALRIDVGTLPDGLTVTVVAKPDGPVVRLRVCYEPHPGHPLPAKWTVPITVASGDQTHHLTLSVHLLAR